ncbi:transcriptional regulator [Microlunatus endophyticus]|uniref:Transcriptional regulator n=1 Tax=Microlunatus endophyticus TaxID=1716077 RepID=A0A917W475_9ACTN|nr:metalloregulator ArsR/SmtB family transcription factor [Microlunatus endophyticus]GGL66084.1 transcriptional regulator [Microlunatus endophyticus]
MNVPREKAEFYASRFRCLAHPTRLLILHVLATEARPLSVGEIVDRVDVGQPTVSAHLRRLVEMGFVLVEHHGTSSLNWLNTCYIERFPAAAEFVMERAAGDLMSASINDPRRD